MPWTTLTEPSLGLGILKAALIKGGHCAQVHHLNLYLLRHLSFGTYEAIAQTFALNDFVFTDPLQDNPLSNQQISLVREICAEVYGAKDRVSSKYKHVDSFVEAMLQVRSKIIPEYLQWCADEVLVGEPSIVGFTCMFDQTIASVALAKLIKKKHPKVVIVLGGYALEGEPGDQILDSFPWIDAIARGDGENVILEIANRVIVDKRKTLGGISGVVTQLDRKLGNAPLPAKASIENAPSPDYSDFFYDTDRLSSLDEIKISLRTMPIESSRGCWWGQKSHCTFCGIDEETMKYREKSAEKVLEELDLLSKQFSPPSFRFNDYILPRSYFKTLIPKLANRDSKFVLGCELKANTSKSELALMYSAGFRELQPGIESFSTAALKKMKKGVSAIQNISFLVNSYELGISVNYNYLFGFPLDTPDDYYCIARVLPLLFHLQPPIDHNGVVLTRFAPLKELPENFGVPPPVKADSRYQVMFSEETADKLKFDYSRYAYYFEAPFVKSDILQNIHGLIQMQLTIWKAQHAARDVYLSVEDFEDGIKIVDTRKSETPVTQTFGIVAKAILESLRSNSHSSFDSVMADISQIYSEAEIKSNLEELINFGFIYSEGKSLIALTIPSSIYRKNSPRWVAEHWIAMQGVEIAV